MDAIETSRLERQLVASCYSEPVKVAAVCVFDLDHTLVSSPLDLQEVARAMEEFARRSGVVLAERELPWYGAEVLELVRTQAPQLERALMEIPVVFERKAMQAAVLEPFVTDTLRKLRRQGYATVLWTNNDSVVTDFVMSRFQLHPLFDLVITRDHLKQLKPNPEGLDPVRGRWPGLPAVVVGDSWVDAAAALAGKLDGRAARHPGKVVRRDNFLFAASVLGPCTFH